MNLGHYCLSIIIIIDKFNQMYNKLNCMLLLVLINDVQEDRLTAEIINKILFLYL